MLRHLVEKHNGFGVFEFAQSNRHFLEIFAKKAKREKPVYIKLVNYLIRHKREVQALLDFIVDESNQTNLPPKPELEVFIEANKIYWRAFPRMILFTPRDSRQGWLDATLPIVKKYNNKTHRFNPFPVLRHD